ncbi:MAG: GNAT family N-acetyltransferase [Bacillota bacterium]|nr:GNAT family N-acetyltransferase [Bacillota bacterium]
MNIKIERATLDDIDPLINVQNQSFYGDYIRYGECPGFNHSSETMASIILNRIVYKIMLDDQIVGDFIVRDNYDNTYYLGGLCIIPECENRGIGQKAIKFVESEFPNATLFTLETPLDKTRNHYIYKKLGYSIAHEYRAGSIKLVLFQKRLSEAK